MCSGKGFESMVQKGEVREAAAHAWAKDLCTCACVERGRVLKRTEWQNSLLGHMGGKRGELGACADKLQERWHLWQSEDRRVIGPPAAQKGLR